MTTRDRMGRVRAAWLLLLATGILLLVASLDWFAGSRARQEAQPSSTGRGGVAAAEHAPRGAADEERLAKSADPAAKSVALGPSARLRLVASEDGEPVVGAELQVVASGGALLLARSDATGSVELPAGNSILVLVRADGRQRAWGVLRLVPEEQRDLRLPGGAGLRLAFVSESGAPVHGIDARLISPEESSGSAPSASWLAGDAADLDRAVRGASMMLRATVPVPSERWETLTVVDDAFRGRVFDELRMESRSEGLLRLGALPFMATTGNDGLLVWDNLAAGEGWRWRVTSEHSVEPDPPFRSVETNPEGKLLVDVAADDHTSGPFALQPGEELTLTVLAYADTGIRGRLASMSGGLVRDAVVRVFDVRHYQAVGDPEGLGIPAVPVNEPQGLLHFAIERALRARPDGAFELLGLSPGDKRLVARWREGDAVVFAVRRFQLELGEVHDLGSIAPHDAEPLHVSIGLVDELGAPLSIENVFEAGESPSCRLTLADGEGVPEAHRIGTTFELELGSELDFYGLFPGRWDLYAAADGSWNLEPGWLIDTRAPKVEASVPGAVVLTMTLMASHEVTLALSSTDVEHLQRMKVFIERTEGRQATLGSWSIRPAVEADASEGHLETLLLPAGRYQFVTVTDSIVDIPLGQGVWGATWVDVPHEGPIPIELRAGVDVEGLAVDAQGQPWPKRELYFCNRLWRISERFELHGVAKTDADGRFVLRGMPPGAVLEEAGTGVTCRLPERPGLHEVRLVLPVSEF